MKTKNIFKTLAFATLLITACSREVIDNEAVENKGFALPATVNVTREGDDATKATFNDGTKKLSFSEGDKLFVSGDAGGYDYEFAGTLDYVSEGTFSGTIYTSKEWTGTADALFTAAIGNNSYIIATLLPAGYESYGYLYIQTDDEYNDEAALNKTYTLATSKAAAVEQFSCELAVSYSSGFALAPDNAILNFTITGLAASTDVDVSLTGSGYTITKTVTTDGSGNATFGAGVEGGTDLNNLSLTVGGNAITLVNSSKPLEAGHIYNITRSAGLTYPIALADATSDYVGSVVTTDGNVYATVGAAGAASKTAVAVIVYVGSAGSVDASSATYKGLAIALSDANDGYQCTWAGTSVSCLSSSQTDDIATALGHKNGISCTSALNGDGHNHTAAFAAGYNNGATAPTGASGWFLPSVGQWNLIVQGLATKKTGSAVTTNLAEGTVNDTYKASNLNSVITSAGGEGFVSFWDYWAVTEKSSTSAWYMSCGAGFVNGSSKGSNCAVRSVIAF